MFTVFGYRIETLPFAAGAALAFLGWTLYWLGINATGAALGGVLGMAFGGGAAILIKREDIILPFMLIAGVLGALFGIFLLRTIHKIVFFIAGVALGMLAGVYIVPSVARMWNLSPNRLDVEIIGKAACGLVVGIFFLSLHRYIVILVTALIGTILLAFSWNFRGGIAVPLCIFFSALIFQIYLVRRGTRRAFSHHHRAEGS